MLDGTFGGGNHTIPLMQTHSNLNAVGFDLDGQTLDKCKEEYAKYINENRLALI